MENNYSPLQWYPIPGYEGLYQINALGTVKSVERLVHTSAGTRIKKKRYLKTRLNNCGYREVSLSRNGVGRAHFLHLLLARVFLSNPLNLKEVNHKNGLKDDNRLENLEFTTRSQNMRHAYQNNLIRKRLKPVVDACSGRTFRSAREAAEFYGLKSTTLRGYLGHFRPNPTCLQYAA